MRREQPLGRGRSAADRQAQHITLYVAPGRTIRPATTFLWRCPPDHHLAFPLRGVPSHGSNWAWAAQGDIVGVIAQCRESVAHGRLRYELDVPPRAHERSRAVSRAIR
jgi:hypothetical protein